MEEPVTILDRDVLKVLSADTRMDIIKELATGSKTPSDLSKKLGKSGATIVEHLDALIKSGLVKEIEQPGKKWIYYTLTERGQGIVSSKSRRLLIILGISMLSIAGGFFSLGRYLGTYRLSQITKASDLTQRIAEESQALAVPAVAQTIDKINPVQINYLYISIAFILIGFLGVLFYIIKKHKRGILYESN